MSVIISMIRVPAGINSIGDDLPTDYAPEPLGNYEEVMAFIKSLFPDADYSDPTYIFPNSDRLIAITILSLEDPVYSVGFRNPSWELIQEVYDKVGWRGINPSDGRIIPPFIPPEHYGFPPDET